MNISDFDNVYITENEWKILKSFIKNPRQNLNDEILNSPNIQRFIFHFKTGTGSFAADDGTCSLNLDGNNYVMYRKVKIRESNIIKYQQIITTVIAVAAFIRAFLPDVINLLKHFL